MSELTSLIEEARAQVTEDDDALRDAQILNALVLKRQGISAAVLFFAAHVYEYGTWMPKFEEFELWLEHAFHGTGIERGQTLFSLSLSFATGLAPWLREKRLIDGDGVIIDAEELLSRAGYSLIMDINTAWWSLWKEWQWKILQDDPISEIEAQILKEEIDERLTACVWKILDPATRRLGDGPESIDNWLKEKGYRQSRDKPEKVPWTTVDVTNSVLVILRVPTDREAVYLTKRLGDVLETFDRALGELAPEIEVRVEVHE